MAQTRSETRCLDNIKCQFIVKQHGVYMTSGESARSTQLRLFQKHLSPVVRVKRLSCAYISRWTRQKPDNLNIALDVKWHPSQKQKQKRKRSYRKRIYTHIKRRCNTSVSVASVCDVFNKDGNEPKFLESKQEKDRRNTHSDITDHVDRDSENEHLSETVDVHSNSLYTTYIANLDGYIGVCSEKHTDVSGMHPPDLKTKKCYQRPNAMTEDKLSMCEPVVPSNDDNDKTQLHAIPTSIDDTIASVIAQALAYTEALRDGHVCQDNTMDVDEKSYVKATKRKQSSKASVRSEKDKAILAASMDKTIDDVARGITSVSHDKNMTSETTSYQSVDQIIDYVARGISTSLTDDSSVGTYMKATDTVIDDVLGTSVSITHEAYLTRTQDAQTRLDDIIDGVARGTATSVSHDVSLTMTQDGRNRLDDTLDYVARGEATNVSRDKYLTAKQDAQARLDAILEDVARGATMSSSHDAQKIGDDTLKDDAHRTTICASHDAQNILNDTRDEFAHGFSETNEAHSETTVDTSPMCKPVDDSQLEESKTNKTRVDVVDEVQTVCTDGVYAITSTDTNLDESTNKLYVDTCEIQITHVGSYDAITASSAVEIEQEVGECREVGIYKHATTNRVTMDAADVLDNQDIPVSSDSETDPSICTVVETSPNTTRNSNSGDNVYTHVDNIAYTTDIAGHALDPSPTIVDISQDKHCDNSHDLNADSDVNDVKVDNVLHLCEPSSLNSAPAENIDAALIEPFNISKMSRWDLPMCVHSSTAPAMHLKKIQSKARPTKRIGFHNMFRFLKGHKHIQGRHHSTQSKNNILKRSSGQSPPGGTSLWMPSQNTPNTTPDNSTCAHTYDSALESSTAHMGIDISAHLVKNATMPDAPPVDITNTKIIVGNETHSNADDTNAFVELPIVEKRTHCEKSIPHTMTISHSQCDGCRTDTQLTDVNQHDADSKLCSDICSNTSILSEGHNATDPVSADTIFSNVGEPNEGTIGVNNHRVSDMLETTKQELPVSLNIPNVSTPNLIVSEQDSLHSTNTEHNIITSINGRVNCDMTAAVVYEGDQMTVIQSEKASEIANASNKEFDADQHKITTQTTIESDDTEEESSLTNMVPYLVKGENVILKEDNVKELVVKDTHSCGQICDQNQASQMEHDHILFVQAVLEPLATKIRTDECKPIQNDLHSKLNTQDTAFNTDGSTGHHKSPMNSDLLLLPKSLTHKTSTSCDESYNNDISVDIDQHAKLQNGDTQSKCITRDMSMSMTEPHDVKAEPRHIQLLPQIPTYMSTGLSDDSVNIIKSHNDEDTIPYISERNPDDTDNNIINIYPIAATEGQILKVNVNGDQEINHAIPECSLNTKHVEQCEPNGNDNRTASKACIPPDTTRKSALEFAKDMFRIHSVSNSPNRPISVDSDVPQITSVEYASIEKALQRARCVIKSDIISGKDKDDDAFSQIAVQQVMDHLIQSVVDNSNVDINNMDTDAYIGQVISPIPAAFQETCRFVNRDQTVKVQITDKFNSKVCKVTSTSGLCAASQDIQMLDTANSDTARSESQHSHLALVDNRNDTASKGTVPTKFNGIDDDPISSDELHIDTAPCDTHKGHVNIHAMQCTAVSVANQTTRGKRKKSKKLTMPTKRRIRPVKRHEFYRPSLKIKIYLPKDSTPQLHHMTTVSPVRHRRKLTSNQHKKRSYPRRESIFYASDYQQSHTNEPPPITSLTCLSESPSLETSVCGMPSAMNATVPELEPSKQRILNPLQPKSQKRRKRKLGSGINIRNP